MKGIENLVQLGQLRLMYNPIEDWLTLKFDYGQGHIRDIVQNLVNYCRKMKRLNPIEAKENQETEDEYDDDEFNEEEEYY